MHSRLTVSNAVATEVVATGAKVVMREANETAMLGRVIAVDVEGNATNVAEDNAEDNAMMATPRVGSRYQARNANEGGPDQSCPVLPSIAQALT